MRCALSLSRSLLGYIAFVLYFSPHLKKVTPGSMYLFGPYTWKTLTIRWCMAEKVHNVRRMQPVRALIECTVRTDGWLQKGQSPLVLPGSVQSWFTPSAHTLETGILQMKQTGFSAEKCLSNHTMRNTAIPKLSGWKPDSSGCGWSHWPQISSQHKQLFCPPWEQVERERGVDLKHSVHPTHHCCPSSCSFLPKMFCTMILPVLTS